MGGAGGIDDLYRSRAKAGLHLWKLIAGIFDGGPEVIEGLAAHRQRSPHPHDFEIHRSSLTGLGISAISKRR
jgi:hypothetical protein